MRYHDAKSGFTVMSVAKPDGEVLPVTGRTRNPAPGAKIQAEGEWDNSRKHGLQLKASKITLTRPKPVEGELPSGHITITGTVVDVRFVSEDSGFTVVECDFEDGPQGASVTGVMPQMVQGMRARFAGTWTEHPRYGATFKAQSVALSRPTTEEGVIAYLSSGLIKGLGHTYAERIVKALGADCIEKIRRNSRLVRTVKGIGPARADSISKSIAEHAGLEDVMQWLLKHEMSTAFALRIFNKYGQESVDRIEENPYVLTKLSRVGFLKADRVALSMGVSPTSAERIDAAVIYTLEQSEKAGHTGAFENQIVGYCAKVLDRVPEQLIRDAIDRGLKEGDLAAPPGTEREGRRFIQRAHMAEVESETADLIYELTHAKVKVPGKLDERIKKARLPGGHELDDAQKAAVHLLCTAPVSLLTGGPGVGKTSTLKVALDILTQETRLIKAAAPTGKAARRMQESTGKEASTIHSLLGWGGGSTFGFDADTKLPCRVLNLDEISMMDSELTLYVLRALKSGCRLILVGDPDQLASVGAGAVLRDLLGSGVLPIANLTKVHRQAAGSQIVKNAHAINRGAYNEIEFTGDCEHVQTQSAEDAAAKLISMVSQRLQSGEVHPESVQVLVAGHRGPISDVELNPKLRPLFNPVPGDEIKSAAKSFAVGDRVICFKNNKDLELTNGTIGYIRSVNTKDNKAKLEVEGEGRYVELGAGDLSYFDLAYAITVHKAQGSEFPEVFMPLDVSQRMLLTRRWFYTGMTRAKQQFRLIGSKQALALAVKNVHERERQTGLQQAIARRFAKDEDVPQVA